MKSTPWIVITLLLIVGTALMLVASVYLFILPKVYQTAALIRISPAGTEKFQDKKASPPFGYFSDHDANSWEHLVSKVVLYQVITNLDLNRKWADQQHLESPLTMDVAYPLLRNQLVVKQPRNTSLARVQVRSINPIESAIIANEIVSVFRLQRESDRAAIIASFLQRMNEKQVRLDTQIQELNDKLRTAPQDTAQTRLLKQQLETARQQIDDEMTAAKTPQPPSVQLIDKAMPPTRAMRPNVFLGAAVLVLGGGINLGALLMLMLQGQAPSRMDA